MRRGASALLMGAVGAGVANASKRTPHPLGPKSAASMLANRPATAATLSQRRLLPSAVPREVRRRQGIDEATRRILLYGVLPVWIGAGLADWWHHRRTQIERTSGPVESAIHSLMMAEAGLPTFLGLFCEVNAGVLAAAAGGVAAHEATAYWDVSYAQSRRHVSPGEQQIHSLLEVVPMAATTLLLAAHWDQAPALFGRGAKRPEVRPRAKSRPLTRVQKAAAIGSIVLFGAVPYAEEMARCLRTRRASESAEPGEDKSDPAPVFRNSAPAPASRTP